MMTINTQAQNIINFFMDFIEEHCSKDAIRKIKSEEMQDQLMKLVQQEMTTEDAKELRMNQRIDALEGNYQDLDKLLEDKIQTMEKELQEKTNEVVEFIQEFKQEQIKKQEAIPNKPKCGKSAYLFFCADHRAAVKDELGDEAKATEITAELVSRWLEVKKNTKAVAKYEEQAKKDKERYIMEAAEYTLFLSRNDRDFVLAAVQEDGYSLEYASEELRNDREIVLAAVQENGYALEYASEELRNDREFVLAAVQTVWYALEYASEELRNDREIVLAAVQTDGCALDYASDELRNDREIVLAAVQKNGHALEYASEELRNDREFIMTEVWK